MKTFKQFYFLTEAKDALATPREGLVKIRQLTPKKFVDFLEVFKKHLKGTKLDLDSLDVNEKVDGSSLRIAMHEGTLKLESSYSGMIDSPSGFKGPWAKPFKETFIFWKKNFEKDLRKIADKYGDFKINGELFFTKDAPIDRDGTITFVATKYDASKLGTSGTTVIFDILGLSNNGTAWSPVDQKVSNSIIKELKKLSNPAWKIIYNKTDLKWSGEVDLTYKVDSETLEKVFKDPSILLDKDKRDFFESFRDGLAAALDRELEKRGSVLGVPDSVVEGIVFNFDNFLISAQNKQWKVLKNEIYGTPGAIGEELKKFFRGIIGFATKKKFLQIVDSADMSDLQDKYSKELDGFKTRIREIKENYLETKDSLPKNFVYQQDAYIQKQFAVFLNLSDDIQSFINAIRNEL